MTKDYSFGNAICDDELPSTIVEALDHIQTMARNSQLSDEFWSHCSSDLDFLCSKLGLNRIQVVFIAILSERGEAMSWRMFGEYLGLSRLKIMHFTPDLEDLMFRHWICQNAAREINGPYEGFKLVRGVIKAFRHNQCYEPERMDNLALGVFMKRLVKYFDEYFSGSMISTDDVGKWILQLVELNQHLPVCKEIMALDDEQSQLIFALALSDFADFGGTDSEGVSIAQLCNLFGEDDTYFQTECLMKNGEHELFGRGLLEFRCADGMIDSDSYVLTDRVRNDLIDGFVPAKVKFTGDKSRQQGLVKFGEITSKLLFLNKKEQTQIDQLKTVISQEGFAKIQERLSECGLRKGIACLFYGGPGTGKTETALQIARQTGRNILKVDISEIRDKWVGESEKNIRGIFKNYRQMCQESDSIPILLFNEADAVINRRIESPFHSVDKMDNAIQNIILEELENLEGIVIATTNLTGAIDDAFDRRFLFKVEFAKPDVEAKASIWESMLKYLNLQDCKLLAKEFDFSGGQIENIARKCKIDYVIKGQLPDIAQVREYCRQEALNRVTTAKVGFCR